MKTVLISLLAAVAIACGAWVIYSKFREEKLTREKYAFRCLAAVVALVTLAVGTIGLKKDLVEQLIDATLLITSRSPMHEEPASMYEQILIVVLVAFAIFLIFNSHRNWEGLVSADEANKRRLQRPNTLVSQALDESARLLRGAPPRELYKDAGRLRGDVKTPAAPPLVWHEHARELFELWYGNSRFDTPASAWDAQVQCWIGRHTKLNQPLLLFCRQEDPTAADLEVIAHYVDELPARGKTLVYVVHRGQTPEIAIQLT